MESIGAKSIGRNMVAFPKDPESPALFIVHVTLGEVDTERVSSTGKSVSVARTDGWGFKFRRDGRSYIARLDISALPETAAEAAAWEREASGKPAKSGPRRASSQDEF